MPSIAQCLEQPLESVHVLRRDQVQQRHAFDVVEGVVTEHLQVGAVGPDVHAFMHVGDGFARGFDECVAATLGFAHLRLEPTQRATGLQVGPLVAHRAEQLLRFVAHRDRPDPAGEGLAEAGFVHGVRDGDDGQVLAAGLHQLKDIVERHAMGLLRGQHQVDGLPGEHRLELVGRGRTQRPDSDARVAKGADDGFRILDAVVDDHQVQRGIRPILHSALRLRVFYTMAAFASNWRAWPWDVPACRHQWALARVAGDFPHQSRHQVA